RRGQGHGHRRSGDRRWRRCCAITELRLARLPTGCSRIGLAGALGEGVRLPFVLALEPLDLGERRLPPGGDLRVLGRPVGGLPTSIPAAAPRCPAPLPSARTWS